SIIRMAGPISEQYRWLLTGIAAVLAVMIANLQSIQSVVQDGHLRIALGGLVISVLLASLAYMLSMAVRVKGEVTAALENEFSTPKGEEVVARAVANMGAERLAEEVRKPFSGPLYWLAKRSAKKGADDPLSIEKGSIALI